MKIFHDDRELVRELLADKGRLISENAELRKQIASLLEIMKKWADQVKQIQQQPRSLPKVPVPAYMAGEIDWQKMGMEEPKPEQFLQPGGKR